MQLVRGLHNLRPRHRGCVATIGNFDGVHRGHQAIPARLRERAAELGLPSCVVIFEPQPREYFSPDRAPARLTRLREKLQLLSEQGVDLVLCLAFNRRLRELSAAEFVHATLVEGLGVRHRKWATISVSAVTAPATSTSCSRLAPPKASVSRRPPPSRWMASVSAARGCARYWPMVTGLCRGIARQALRDHRAGHAWAETRSPAGRADCQCPAQRRNTPLSGVFVVTPR